MSRFSIIILAPFFVIVYERIINILWMKFINLHETHIYTIKKCIKEIDVEMINLESVIYIKDEKLLDKGLSENFIYLAAIYMSLEG